MPTSPAEQRTIQTAIDCADRETRERMRAQADAACRSIGSTASTQVIKGRTQKEFEYSVEMLVRLEATELGKGAFYRMKRRFGLMRKYFR